MAIGDFEDREELFDAVFDRFQNLYEDTYRWEAEGGADSTRENLEHLSDDQLFEVWEFSDQEFGDLAEYGFAENMEDPPDWLLEMGWYDDDGDWHNPFWYH